MKALGIQRLEFLVGPELWRRDETRWDEQQMVRPWPKHLAGDKIFLLKKTEVGFCRDLEMWVDIVTRGRGIPPRTKVTVVK